MKVMVIVKATKNSEAGIMPSEKLLSDMGKFNEELVKAGIMQSGEGLHPSVKAKRIQFSGGNTTVIDGPFAETKELVAGFWIWKVKSMEEAVSWARRCPDPMPGEDSDARDPSHFRGGRFRRRVHAGAAGKERTSARRDRTAAEAVGGTSNSWLSTDRARSRSAMPATRHPSRRRRAPVIRRLQTPARRTAAPRR